MRVLVVDDQAVIRAGLRSILESGRLVVVGEAADGVSAARMARALVPDVVLMDLRMPVRDGIAATRDIRADPALEAVRVLALTTFEGDEHVLEALRAGADGFLGKSADPDELIDAVLRTGRGDAVLSASASRTVVAHLGADRSHRKVEPALAAAVATLTAREQDLVVAAASGDDNATIAQRLGISPFTVKTHLNRAMSKLGARDRGQLVSIAYRSGIAR